MIRRSITKNRLFFLLGLFLVLLYGFFTHPRGLNDHEYGEDSCNQEMARQIMGENLRDFGKPEFTTDKLMVPHGMNAVFFEGWNIERDWLGGYIWNLKHEIPFNWIHFLVSIAISFIGVGWIARKMGVGSSLAWSAAAIAVIFNIPRHHKLWGQPDHVMMHWVYLSFFLDAWIWQKFFRENKLSIQLELWRALLLLLTFCTMGYFWGPSILEWLLVRACMVALIVSRYRKNNSATLEPINVSRAMIPAALCMGLILIQIRWFFPLMKEFLKFGSVDQPAGWNAPIAQIFQPLWFEQTMYVDTFVTIGWLYWIPVFLSFLAFIRNHHVSRMRILIPFALLTLIGALYIHLTGAAGIVVRAVQETIPFMNFFRVSSRFALFLPVLAAVIVLLSWNELNQWLFRLRPRMRSMIYILFVLSSLLEARWLLKPLEISPTLPDSTVQMLNRIKQSSGSEVLTLPFCVAGANGVCTNEQCPFFPQATLGACMRLWHGKKVYGAYSSRMQAAECEVYANQPFSGMFSAWKENRCFNENEWKNFCQYLSSQTELSALLVFPDIWSAAGSAECQEKIRQHLGAPVEEATFLPHSKRSAFNAQTTRIQKYATKCLEKDADPK